MKITTALEQVVDAALHVVAPGYARERTEQPAHEVLIDEEPFQLRRYAPQLVATVTVTGDRDKATDEAFGQLASFIFATDREGEEIDMTTPVTQAVRGADPMVTMSGSGTAAGRYAVRFIMPAKWTRETLPKPSNPDISIEELPARKMAVATFSGRATDEAVREHGEKLRGFMERHGLQGDGTLEYAYYDPPFTPPPLRRNEVMMGVSEE